MPLTVTTWVDRLLGIRTEAGEGVAWSIDYSWPWPAWITLLLAALAVMFVVAVYLREGGHASRRYRITLALLRIVLVGVALSMIAQVALSIKRTELPCVAVIVDDSQSMTTVDRYEGAPRRAMSERLKRAGIDGSEPSRWNLARMLLTERDNALLRGIARGHRLRVYFLTGTRPSRRDDAADAADEIRASSAGGDSTRLGAGVRTVLDDLRGTAPAALVLLTDGINTDGPPLSDAADYARRRGVPLLIIGLGSDQPVCDLKLSDLLVDDVVFAGDVVTFECRLTATGFRGEKATVVLREKGRPKVLAKAEVAIDADAETKQVRIPFRPTETGRFEYVVEVEPQQGESQTANNRQTHAIEVRKDKLRVLLVEAHPGFEFRYLRNMLKRDEAIELHTFLQEADAEHVDQDAAALSVFPLRRDELFAYDAIIFGDVNPALLNATALQNLADFVAQPAKGGALVLIAGPSFMPAAYGDTPLARLLPFRMDRRAIPARRRSWRWVCGPPQRRRPGHAADATRRYARGNAANLAQSAAALLAVGAPRLEAGRPRAGRASDAPRPRWTPSAGLLPPVRRRRQGPLPGDRRDVAMAFSHRG